jgi:pimeloyl-ACP methyl ester carboxylesterase
MMATASADMHEEIISVGNGRVDMRVLVRGSGPPVVWLHPAGGFAWNPFLESLAQERTVYAPLVPGTSPADPNAIDEVRDLWELILLEQEALFALGLQGADLVGNSFGGMLACELQATFPGAFGKLVLFDPIGLWRDDVPVGNVLMAAPEELPALLFADPAGPAAEAMFTLPTDQGARADVIAGLTWAMGCTAKFWWPVPDRGLSRRLHRITAATLVIWGADDALISAAYADEFGARITDARIAIIKDCGHVPQVEKPDETFALVAPFLGLTPRSLPSRSGERQARGHDPVGSRIGRRA